MYVGNIRINTYFPEKMGIVVNKLANALGSFEK